MPSGGRSGRRGIKEQVPLQAPEGGECPGGGDGKRGTVLRKKEKPMKAKTPRRLSGGPAKGTKVKKARDRDDWQVETAIFQELQMAYGPFTLDACADQEGRNALVPRYCSPITPCRVWN